MEEKKIVQLKHSIPVEKQGGGTVQTDRLEFGRFKAKHLRLLPKSFMKDKGNINPEDVLPLIAGLTDLPKKSIEEIDLEDLETISEALSDFFETSLSQVTGKK